MAGVAVHEDATKDPKIDQLPAEEKKSRRSLRGRRSSIKLVPEGASPGMVVAPLSESVVGDADMSPSAQLSKKRDRILTYMSHLQAEKEDWENRLQRREQLWERAKCIAERGLERKRIERVPVDELGRVDTGQKPRYVLNRIVRAFNKQNEDLHKQKVMNDILARRAVLKESLTKVKMETTSLAVLLSAEPRDELLALEKWWAKLKSAEEARIPLLQAKLARLEMEEAVRN